MPSFEIEKQYQNETIYGIDEAGLGPLAGPIVVASCHIISQKLSNELFENINDSKKISKKKRDHLFEIITNDPYIKFGISIIDSETIDEIGLSKAWTKGIVESIKDQNPTLCLVDGIRKIEFPNGCKSISIVKGDSKSFSIAAASIIAKVTRDRIMDQIHKEFPYYGFDKHVGYGTRLHINQLTNLGPCKYHRKSYAPVRLASRESNSNS